MASTMDQITALLGELSFAEKLTINEQLATSIRKEGGKGKVTKSKKVKDDDEKPKRKAALGTLAWTAYVKHIKETQPEAFEGLKKEAEKLVIVKGIRAEDPEGYKTFTDEWKAAKKEESDAETASASETASVAEEPPAPVAKPVKKAEPKAAAKKETEKKETKKTEKKEVEKKEVKKVVKKAAKKEEPTMPQKEIDGTNYWHDPESNGLWEVTGETVADGTGAWIGYFQPGNDDEPIRFTEAFGSD